MLNNINFQNLRLLFLFCKNNEFLGYRLDEEIKYQDIKEIKERIGGLEERIT